MELSLTAQTVAFFITVLSGVLFGMIYDILRIFRIAVRHKTVAIIIEDIIFFTVIAFLTFLLALAQDRGDIRLYHIIGEILGFVIYYLTLGEAVLAVADKIILAVRFIFAIINRFIISPILWLIKKIIALPIALFKRIISIFKKILKKLKFVLKKRCILLYNSNVVKKSQAEKSQKEDKADEGKKKRKRKRNRKKTTSQNREAVA